MSLSFRPLTSLVLRGVEVLLEVPVVAEQPDALVVEADPGPGEGLVAQHQRHDGEEERVAGQRAQRRAVLEGLEQLGPFGGGACGVALPGEAEPALREGLDLAVVQIVQGRREEVGCLEAVLLEPGDPGGDQDAQLGLVGEAHDLVDETLAPVAVEDLVEAVEDQEGGGSADRAADGGSIEAEFSRLPCQPR